MIVYPESGGPKGLESTLELGPFPTAANNCTLWKNTLRQEGQRPVVKDYLLCRRNSDEDLFTDERNGIILDTQWIGNILITPYKADHIFYVVTNRFRGKTMEEEIITVNDTTSGTTVQVLQTYILYRTVYERIE